ncbi:MAG: GNAT family N-acetyltransferase [Pseudomonas sp.]|uniref:GNAT family N-acetyltransferase n=1 Tax=Pseudomonas sp. TaxID=306 RepID=UPI003390D947
MRANRTAQLWVARRVEIVGGLCLNSLDGGFWLTALLVDPLQRRQAIASHLIRQVLASTVQPVWLFCHPELVPFYERLGFATTRSLPTALSDRLARYGRSKPLLAMVCPPKALASAVLGR